MKRTYLTMLLSALAACASAPSHASDMCDTLGDTAQGIALNKRDAGVSESALLSEVNERKPGGLSDDNRAMVVSIVHMVYARRDLTPAQLGNAARASCEGVPAP